MRAMGHRPSLIAATLPEHYDTTFVDNDRELAKLAPGLAVLAVYWQRRFTPHRCQDRNTRWDSCRLRKSARAVPDVFGGRERNDQQVADRQDQIAQSGADPDHVIDLVEDEQRDEDDQGRVGP